MLLIAEPLMIAESCSAVVYCDSVISVRLEQELKGVAPIVVTPRGSTIELILAP